MTGNASARSDIMELHPIKLSFDYVAKLIELGTIFMKKIFLFQHISELATTGTANTDRQ